MIHIRSCIYTPRPKRADVRLSENKRLAIKRDLENEIVEARMSAQPVSRRNEHIHRSAEYRQKGGE